MTDNNSGETSDTFKDAARRSQEAGIADESAAYETASEDAPTSADKGERDQPTAEEAAAQLGDFA